jgi:hypothetical protein
MGEPNELSLQCVAQNFCSKNVSPRRKDREKFSHLRACAWKGSQLTFAAESLSAAVICGRKKERPFQNLFVTRLLLGHDAGVIPRIARGGRQPWQKLKNRSWKSLGERWLP